MRHKWVIAAAVGCSVALTLLLDQWHREANGQKNDHANATPQDKRAVIYGHGFQILVSPGTEAQALAYYKDVLTKNTSFKTDPRPALDDLLHFFGFSIIGEDLEKDEPDEIMKGFPGGEVLVARFFAPKITDVSKSPPDAYGWRKVVRLRAQSSSDAAKSGLKTLLDLCFVVDSYIAS